MTTQTYEIKGPVALVDEVLLPLTGGKDAKGNIIQPLTQDYLDRRLMESREVYSFPLEDGTYLVARRYHERKENEAVHSKDLFGQEVITCYRWMALQDQTSIYGRELDKLVSAYTRGDISTPDYNAMLADLNKRNKESETSFLNRSLKPNNE